HSSIDHHIKHSEKLSSFRISIGFGKSQIPEMFYDLIPKVSKVVGVVLNPLKALGYNQVLEKNAAGFTTMNLTKLTFHTGEAKKIQHDKENFVWWSYMEHTLFITGGWLNPNKVSVGICSVPC
ncbi:uncharacterized protein VP01_6555g1, partial [Puccinia sorghi]